ncbi:outer membrane receptor protein involved in Fe transport [Chryseobacterium sediminis]|uniref:Outer membrane receptor protein involved in Fe transport n=1 Tax=Chryseobacterium sediminis TaxID=1679494 RepID=A0ABR6Q2X2_9FLAO|nr:TonB-dependent receptor plug domain-containing protein [Chryseobacterium sediminis]MBB6332301.1 outer membrane receptor protein involved in Fe transport [Chryseobacterium sediminis]
MKLINKSILTAVITLSTASVYYAQQVQDTVQKSKDIDEVILRGVTDIAKDRKTPVAVSTIKAAQILERQGNQELVELLNTTPSVYATKGGGGFGDSQITMRGFESRNIAVMVNGMPVNDMEGGTVYFSNWTGLSDVTSTMQVQRGLGSSKLAIASVGGTMNFLTKSADMKRGGILRFGVGNNDYLKTSFAYNTGKSENGWSSSILMSRQAGSTYIENTQYESYAYYFALGWEPNKKHNFQFTLTSAPQWHNQRTFSPTIQNYIKYNPDHDGTPYRQYNSDYGYYTDANGNKVSLANRANYYSKPVMMLNWDWTMSEKSKLSTVLYMSNGRGGGTGELGRVGGKGITDASFLDTEGHFNYDAIFAANKAVNVNTAGAGSTLIRRSSINSHNWYGILANFQHKINDNWNFSVGTDDRYYYGYHYQVASDLYGASGYKDSNNKNIAPNIVNKTYNYQQLAWNPFGGKTAPIQDQIGYSNDGEVIWYSGFGQVEFTKNDFSAFLQGSVSNQGYQRIDNFIQDGVTKQQGQVVNTKTGFKNLFGYNIKGGANYNINANHNVFANVGYYSKQPFFNSVYPSNFQVVNPTLTNEKIFSAEVGYGFRSPKFSANVNVYRTQWGDRWLRRTNQTFTLPDNTTTTGYAEISGITEVHQGVEFDAVYRPTNFLEFQGMFSWGDYYYKGNATGAAFDDNNNPLTLAGTSTSTTLYLDKVKVGGTSNNSIPQMTASLGATVKPVKDLSIFGTWRYVGKLYSSIDIATFSNQAAQDKGVMKLPDFNLFDVGFSYKIRLRDSAQYFTIGANVYNLFDTTYISDASTNVFTKTSDQFATAAQYEAYQSSLYKGIDPSNRVLFGFGRTWAANLSFNF